jgi:hypothetical protein
MIGRPRRYPRLAGARLRDATTVSIATAMAWHARANPQSAAPAQRGGPRAERSIFDDRARSWLGIGGAARLCSIRQHTLHARRYRFCLRAGAGPAEGQTLAFRAERACGERQPRRPLVSQTRSAQGEGAGSATVARCDSRARSVGCPASRARSRAFTCRSGRVGLAVCDRRVGSVRPLGRRWGRWRGRRRARGGS